MRNKGGGRNSFKGIIIYQSVDNQVKRGQVVRRYKSVLKNYLVNLVTLVDSYNENKIWIKKSKDVAHPEKEVYKSGRLINLIFLTL